jgi:hypothetical protein
MVLKRHGMTTDADFAALVTTCQQTQQAGWNTHYFFAVA